MLTCRSVFLSRVGSNPVGPDGNGFRDVIVRFLIPDTGIKCGDTSASLTGQTFNGLSFVGASPIKTVQCGQER